MAITGHVYKITDRLGFFGAVATGGDPPHTSFGSMGRVQVELRTTFGPENFDVVISQQVMSNDHGLFILHRPSQLGSGLETTRNMQLVVRKQTSHSNVGPFHFRVFESIYRSRPFAWTAVNDTEQPISMFVDFGTTPDEDAITGKTVDEGITSAVSALTANHITDVEAYGFIWSDGVNMHLAGNLPSGGNRFISDFRIVLIGSESTNLHEFFTADLADFHSQHICFLSSLKERPQSRGADSKSRHDLGFWRRRDDELGQTRPAPIARRSRRAEGGQGRPQAARRGSLDGPGDAGATLEHEARQGFVRAPLLYSGRSSLVDSRTRWAVSRSRMRSGAATPKLGCRSSLRRNEAGMERCGRSQAGSIRQATSPDGGHDTSRARALAAPERAHPASARQRISPSRRP